MLLLLVLCSALIHQTVCSAADHCPPVQDNRPQIMSPLLQSLQCFNDYESQVVCRWRKHRNTTMELWFETEDGRELCEPYSAADTHEDKTVHCRYKTKLFVIGVKHTVFFMKKHSENICSAARRTTLDLIQHLKALPPVNLSTHEAGDGGWRISWSSPYPSSSSLSRNLSYQLSYRTHRQDSWTTKNMTTSAVTLEKRVLLPGRRYEARVRVRAGVGQWSDWSPAVTWQTRDDVHQLPSVHCVLGGEGGVVCSWEVSRDLDASISYQLLCRRNPTAPSERCCENPTVQPDHSGALLSYSCSLTLPASHNLLLDLRQTLRARSFEAHQHIRPKPPRQLKVREEEGNWKVEWNEPSTASRLRLSYQVCYYRTPDQGSVVLLNISEGSQSVSILGKSLQPLQTYQLKVRSLLVPGDGSLYEGTPSEWSDAVEWTSHSASWSSSTLIYILLSVFVASFFFILYCSVPACRRKVVLWVESVPSPGKSKILSEMKRGASVFQSNTRTLMQSEKTFICRVQQLDNVSTCSSDALLWNNKSRESNGVDQDQSCWDGDAASSPDGKNHDSDTSSMSFSGPYIFCQSSKQTSNSVKNEDKHTESPSVSDSPSPLNFSVFGDGYVHLPSPSVSRSTQDLVSHRHEDPDPQVQTRTEQDQQDQQGPDLRESSSRDQQGPDLRESSIRDQQGPDLRESSIRDQQRPDLHPSSRDQQGPDLRESSIRDQHGPDLRESSSRDQQGPDLRESSSRDQHGPDLSEFSSRDKQGPDLRESSSRDQRGPDPRESSSRDQHGPDFRESSIRDQQGPDLSRDQPPDYTSEAVSCWPQISAVQASGYCHLPPAFPPAFPPAAE